MLSTLCGLRTHLLEIPLAICGLDGGCPKLASCSIYMLPQREQYSRDLRASLGGLGFVSPAIAGSRKRAVVKMFGWSNCIISIRAKHAEVGWLPRPTFPSWGKLHLKLCNLGADPKTHAQTGVKPARGLNPTSR